ncbi:Vacuolar protein 8 [Mortierella polycephala]|uniref:Vacuolar protein 8 n=1 Tax=Mortierella polycephala TaxID=41804 RepID=A0A9P6U796_9FUNG|nr:Vacuolar protein 8 [Mortierella polycephala]
MSTDRSFQAFRVSGVSSTASAINIATRLDNKTGQHIVLWKDVQRVFENAKYITTGTTALSFMTDDNFEDILPLRIECQPGTVLEVVVDGPASATAAVNAPLSSVSPQQSLPAPVFAAASATPQNTSPVQAAPASPPRSPSPPPEYSPRSTVGTQQSLSFYLSSPTTTTASTLNSDMYQAMPPPTNNNANLNSLLPQLLNLSVSDITYLPTSYSQAEVYSAAEEQRALEDVVLYLQNPRAYDFFYGTAARTLTILSFSPSKDVQLVAALAFAKVTVNSFVSVGRETISAIIHLLKTQDTTIQISALIGLAPLTIPGMLSRLQRGSRHPQTGKVYGALIVHLGGLEQIIPLMSSTNVELQVEAAGAILNLAILARSTNPRVQVNATGSILNMTMSNESMNQVVDAGAIPVLSGLLNSTHSDILQDCATTLKNITSVGANRDILARTQPNFVNTVIRLLSTTVSANAQGQAALILRNLALDTDYQMEITKLKGVPPLMQLLKSTNPTLIFGAFSCLYTLFVQPIHQPAVMEAGFMSRVIELLEYDKHPNILALTVTTLYRLASESKNRSAIVDGGVIERYCALLPTVIMEDQTEMLATLAIIPLNKELKPRMLAAGLLKVLVSMTNSPHEPVQTNSALTIGSLATQGTDYRHFIAVWLDPQGGLCSFLLRFIKSPDRSFQRHSITIMIQLLEGENADMRRLILGSTTIADALFQLIKDTQAGSPNYEFQQSVAVNRMNTTKETILSMIRQLTDLIK